MYQGKHSRKKRSRWNKPVLIVVSLVLIVTVALSGTLAFLLTGTGDVENTFTPSRVTTSVEETLSGSTKSDVKIKNTGDTDAWIRAAVVVTWQDAQGNVYGQEPEAGENYTDWTPGTDWVKGADGFYYYKSPVAAGETTANALITSIAPIGPSPADGYYLTVEIIGSGIQNKPANAFNTAWASSGLKVKDTPKDNPMQWTLE